MTKYLSYIFFCFLSIQTLFGQGVHLSVYSQVSIITVGPGEKLYERFGHSAIEIKDHVLQLDLVYNYGVFDFNAPHFYTNFVKGKLLYRMERYPFHYLIESSKRDRRWVKKQVLNLTQEQKQSLFIYLENNAMPRNASYLYNPFFNNCATKLRDVVKTVLDDKVSFSSDFVHKKQSFRQLMNQRINWNTWGSLGINVLLGSNIDRIANPSEYMYLPDYVFESFEKATISGTNGEKKLVKKQETLLDFKPKKSKPDTVSPFLVLSLIALIGLYITYRDYKKNKRNKWLDFILFALTGLMGFIIVFLWFFTDHKMISDNFNILWAFPPNLIIAFILLKNKPQKWVKKYFLFLLILSLLIPVVWMSGTQLLPLSLYPILLLLFVRYFYLNRNYLVVD